MSTFLEIPVTKYALTRRSLIFGKGINDADYITKPKIAGKKVTCPYYQRWYGMLERCYSSKLHTKRPTYSTCESSPEWLYFSNFRSWMIKQDWQGKHLDKDILIPNNKIYSPETCMFVTSQINTLLVGCFTSSSEYPKGVTKVNGRFQVRYAVSGEKLSVGCYATPEEASYAYKVDKAKHIRSVATTQEEPLKSALMRHADILHVSFI